MVISFSDGEALHGKEAEKFSFFEDALKLVLQAYANGAFTSGDLKKRVGFGLWFFVRFTRKERGT